MERTLKVAPAPEISGDAQSFLRMTALDRNPKEAVTLERDPETSQSGPELCACFGGARCYRGATRRGQDGYCYLHRDLEKSIPISLLPKSAWRICIWMIRQLWIQPTNSLSKHEKLCRMILNWREPSAKYPTREKIILVLFNCCGRVPVRPRWTPRGPTTWGHRQLQQAKAPSHRGPGTARWQLGFRSRLLRMPGGCSLKQKLNDEFCARSHVNVRAALQSTWKP